ncbi:hypothetical protein [Rosistilla oblonga]|uniref:hypothetical protein n=1 Tax=Rosistilla oblonga TaxID=2527990 RepID=UPI003A9823FF
MSDGSAESVENLIFNVGVRDDANMVSTLDALADEVIRVHERITGSARAAMLIPGIDKSGDGRVIPQSTFESVREFSTTYQSAMASTRSGLDELREHGAGVFDSLAQEAERSAARQVTAFEKAAARISSIQAEINKTTSFSQPQQQEAATRPKQTAIDLEVQQTEVLKAELVERERLRAEYEARRKSAKSVALSEERPVDRASYVGIARDAIEKDPVIRQVRERERQASQADDLRGADVRGSENRTHHRPQGFTGGPIVGASDLTNGASTIRGGELESIATLQRVAKMLEEGRRVSEIATDGLGPGTLDQQHEFLKKIEPALSKLSTEPERAITELVQAAIQDMGELAPQALAEFQTMVSKMALDIDRNSLNADLTTARRTTGSYGSLERDSAVQAGMVALERHTASIEAMGTRGGASATAAELRKVMFDGGNPTGIFEQRRQQEAEAERQRMEAEAKRDRAAALRGLGSTGDAFEVLSPLQLHDRQLARQGTPEERIQRYIDGGDKFAGMTPTEQRLVELREQQEALSGDGSAFGTLNEQASQLNATLAETEAEITRIEALLNETDVEKRNRLTSFTTQLEENIATVSGLTDGMEGATSAEVEEFKRRANEISQNGQSGAAQANEVSAAAVEILKGDAAAGLQDIASVTGRAESSITKAINQRDKENLKRFQQRIIDPPDKPPFGPAIDVAASVAAIPHFETEAAKQIALDAIQREKNQVTTQKDSAMNRLTRDADELSTAGAQVGRGLALLGLSEEGGATNEAMEKLIVTAQGWYDVVGGGASVVTSALSGYENLTKWLGLMAEEQRLETVQGELAERQTTEEMAALEANTQATNRNAAAHTTLASSLAASNAARKASTASTVGQAAMAGHNAGRPVAGLLGHRESLERPVANLNPGARPVGPTLAHHSVLGITGSATRDEINAAHRRQMAMSGGDAAIQRNLNAARAQALGGVGGTSSGQIQVATPGQIARQQRISQHPAHNVGRAAVGASVLSSAAGAGAVGGAGSAASVLLGGAADALVFGGAMRAMEALRERRAARQTGSVLARASRGMRTSAGGGLLRGLGGTAVGVGGAAATNAVAGGVGGGILSSAGALASGAISAALTSVSSALSAVAGSVVALPAILASGALGFASAGYTGYEHYTASRDGRMVSDDSWSTTTRNAMMPVGNTLASLAAMTWDAVGSVDPTGLSAAAGDFFGFDTTRNLQNYSRLPQQQLRAGIMPLAIQGQMQLDSVAIERMGFMQQSAAMQMGVRHSAQQQRDMIDRRRRARASDAELDAGLDAIDSDGTLSDQEKEDQKQRLQLNHRMKASRSEYEAELKAERESAAMAEERNRQALEENRKQQRQREEDFQTVISRSVESAGGHSVDGRQFDNTGTTQTTGEASAVAEVEQQHKEGMLQLQREEQALVNQTAQDRIDSENRVNEIHERRLETLRAEKGAIQDAIDANNTRIQQNQSTIESGARSFGDMDENNRERALNAADKLKQGVKFDELTEEEQRSVRGAFGNSSLVQDALRERDERLLTPEQRANIYGDEIAENNALAADSEMLEGELDKNAGEANETSSTLELNESYTIELINNAEAEAEVVAGRVAEAVNTYLDAKAAAIEAKLRAEFEKRITESNVERSNGNKARESATQPRGARS